jgi:hypothetical protein
MYTIYPNRDSVTGKFSFTDIIRQGASGEHVYADQKQWFYKTVAWVRKRFYNLYENKIVSWFWINSKYLVIRLSYDLYNNYTKQRWYMRQEVRFDYAEISTDKISYKMSWQTSYDQIKTDFPSPSWGGLIVSSYRRVIAGYSYDELSLTHDNFYNLIRSWAHTLNNYIPSTDINCWGDLCSEAISNVQMLDINSIQYLRELVTMKASLIATYKLLQGNVSAKNISKLYLGLRYGLKLTIQDSKEILDALVTSAAKFAHPKWTSTRAQCMDYSSIDKGALAGIGIEQSHNYKIYYEPVDRGFKNLMRGLMNWDLAPTTQNLWDLIPLSFVVDWFVDMEAFFTRTDNRLYVNTLDVQGVIRTTKTTFRDIDPGRLSESPWAGWTLTGSLDYSFYTRELGRQLTLPRFRIDTPKEFRNYAELTAIILSR